MRERDAEPLRCLDDAPRDQLVGEGAMERPVRGERGAVVRDPAVGEVDLEHRRLAGNLRGAPRRARGGRSPGWGRGCRTVLRPGAPPTAGGASPAESAAAWSALLMRVPVSKS